MNQGAERRFLKQSWDGNLNISFKSQKQQVSRFRTDQASDDAWEKSPSNRPKGQRVG